MSTTTHTYTYNPTRLTLTVRGTEYKVVQVVDHLEDIMKATTSALADYTKGNATALDFSAIRPRGSKTSHAGIATGAASFAKAFSDLVHVLSNVDDNERYRPIAILVEDHPDIEEYVSLSTPEVILLIRDKNWNLRPIDTGKPTPNWELDSGELKELNSERSRRASPWYEN